MNRFVLIPTFAAIAASFLYVVVAAGGQSAPPASTVNTKVEEKKEKVPEPVGELERLRIEKRLMEAEVLRGRMQRLVDEHGRLRERLAEVDKERAKLVEKEQKKAGEGWLLTLPDFGWQKKKEEKEGKK